MDMAAERGFVRLAEVKWLVSNPIIVSLHQIRLDCRHFDR